MRQEKTNELGQSVSRYEERKFTKHWIFLTGLDALLLFILSSILLSAGYHRPQHPSTIYT